MPLELGQKEDFRDVEPGSHPAPGILPKKPEEDEEDEEEAAERRKLVKQNQEARRNIIKSYTAGLVPEPCGYAVLLLNEKE
jgi:hypothetical protein